MKPDSIRKIIHVDMDCFYAAVETLDFPELKGKPMAIGGGERGVLSTSNYEARRFGVKSAMPTRMALKLCPHLILRPHRFERYKELSKKVKEIFHRHTDLVEPLSLDEAFLDVSKNKDYAGSATWLAKAIQQEIKKATGLTASAGVAPNKFLAKVASDWNKPNGLFVIKPNEVSGFVKELPVGNIFGVGKVAQENLKRWNIFTCGDLQSWSKEDLNKEFGSWSIDLYNYSRGIDEREVRPHWNRKSLSVETTFLDDRPIEDLIDSLPALFEELNQRLEKARSKQSLAIKTIYLKLKTHDFETSTTDKAYTDIPCIDTYKELLEKLYEKKNKACRLIGIGYRFDEPDGLLNLQESFPLR